VSTDFPPGAAKAPDRTGRVAWGPVVLENLGVLVVFALGGALAGWIWERWVTLPQGVVFEGRWRLGYRIEGDYFVGDNDLFQRAFGVIGTFVVLGLLIGLVIGVLAPLVCRRSELVTLTVVAAGSVLAAVVCYRVGLALGPPDPAGVARTAADGTIVAGNLSLAQRSPFIAWPVGSLVGLAAVYLLTSGVSAGMKETRRVGLSGPDGPRGSEEPVAPTHPA
jgi:hypothetical protein